MDRPVDQGLDPRMGIPRIKPGELTMRGRNNKRLRTGVGGFSSVYAGVLEHQGRTIPVAVKYYKDRLMRTEQGVDRFYEEALGHYKLSQLGRANGCNIVPFFGVFEHSNQRRVKRAIVMQRMRRSLADLIRSASAESLPLLPGIADRLRMLAQVAHSLAVMHEHFYQHLDVKPENALLDERENCFISDFGLSRLRLPSATVGAASRPGGYGVAGTAGYICPEVGGGARRGAASDVFALGIMAWEVLALRRAWHGARDDVDPDTLNSRVWHGERPDAHALADALHGCAPAADFARRLLPRCWGSTAEGRPTAREVCEALKAAAALAAEVNVAGVRVGAVAAAGGLATAAAAALRPPGPTHDGGRWAHLPEPPGPSGGVLRRDGDASSCRAPEQAGAEPPSGGVARGLDDAVSGTHALISCVLLPPPGPVQGAAPGVSCGANSDDDEDGDSSGSSDDDSEAWEAVIGATAAAAAGASDSGGVRPAARAAVGLWPDARVSHPAQRQHLLHHHQTMGISGLVGLGGTAGHAPPAATGEPDTIGVPTPESLSVLDCGHSPTRWPLQLLAPMLCVSPASPGAGGGTLLSRVLAALSAVDTVDGHITELDFSRIITPVSTLLRRTRSATSEATFFTGEGGDTVPLSDESVPNSPPSARGGASSSRLAAAPSPAPDREDASAALDAIAAALAAARHSLRDIFVAVADESWWGPLCDALAPCRELRRLQISARAGTTTTRGVCCVAFTALRLPLLAHLSLSGTDLSAVRSAYALAAALPELPSLTGLDLFNTRIVEAGWASLGPVVAGLASLERLDIGCNPEMLGEGDCSEDLCDVLERLEELRCLGLSGLGLDDSEAEALSEVLGSLSLLETCDLSDNQLTDSSVRLVTDALLGARSPPELRHLNLGFNELTPASFPALLQFLRHAAHLEAPLAVVSLAGNAGEFTRKQARRLRAASPPGCVLALP